MEGDLMGETQKRAPLEPAKSDDYIAWLGQFRPPIEIRFLDGSIATVPFDRIDETIALHREETRGERPAPMRPQPEPPTTGKVRRVYLWKDEKPPEGAEVHEGRTSGKYYEVAEGYRWHKGKQIPKA